MRIITFSVGSVTVSVALTDTIVSAGTTICELPQSL
jgi:hypothetical protein